MTVTRRNLTFPLDHNAATRWHAGGAPVSRVYNAVSVFLPVGERFFIDSVRAYRHHPNAQSPTLQADIKAFIGQEAMHGREHEALNAALEAAGMPVSQAESRIQRLLDWSWHTFPRSFSLAATCALEHYTATLAHTYLSHQRYREAAPGGQPFSDMWLWHALEEVEHKDVAFNLYKATVGRSRWRYFERIGAFVFASALFFTLKIAVLYQFGRAERRLDRASGRRGATFWSDTKATLRFGLGRHGILRAGAKSLLAYFKPGFHPTDHGTVDLEAWMPPLERQYAA